MNIKEYVKTKADKQLGVEKNIFKHFKTVFRDEDDKFIPLAKLEELGYISKRTGEATERYWSFRYAHYKRTFKKEYKNVSKTKEIKAHRDKLAKDTSIDKADARKIKLKEKQDKIKVIRLANLEDYRKELRAMEFFSRPKGKRTEEEINNIQRLPKGFYKEDVDVMYCNLKTPYNLDRRSGYKTIWQVLALHASKDKDERALNSIAKDERPPQYLFVSWKTLSREVNKMLKKEACSSAWYRANYSETTPYNVINNSKVIARYPYNKMIEELGQRIVIDDEYGAILITNTNGIPRVLKSHGRNVQGSDTRNIIISSK
jgi:hypothetical protein